MKRSDGPFQRPTMPKKGDKDHETLFKAVGRALSIWEHTETVFADIFAKLTSPKGSGYASRRAYGSVISAPARRQMLDAAAEVFFRNFPNEEAQKLYRDAIVLHSQASSRRNDIAHGIMGGDIVDGNFAGYFIVPSTWTSKSRRMNLTIDYRYSSVEIDEFRDKFVRLGALAFGLHRSLQNAYDSSPKKARELY